MSRSLRAAVLVALAAPISGVAGCGGASGQGEAQATNVDAADFAFRPQRLQIKRGQAVRWTNTGQTAHTVKGPGFFTTRALDPGQSYSFRFARPGTYRYLCTLHPTLMTAVITVK